MSGGGCQRGTANPERDLGVADIEEGKTMLSMAAKPAPSSVNRMSFATTHPSRVTGEDALARSPRPSQAAEIVMPGASAGIR